MESLLKYAMLFSVIFNGVEFGAGGNNFNIERIAIITLFVPIVCFVAYTTLTTTRLEKIPFSRGSLIVLWCLGLLLSLFLTDNPQAHYNGYLISIGPVLLYFLFSSGKKSTEIIQTAVEPMLWYLAGGAVTVYAISRVLAPDWITPYTDIGRVRLSLLEANIYGATISYFFILHFPQFKRCWRHYILYVLSTAAVVFSFSKAPYVGFVCGVVTYLVLTGYLKKVHGQLTAIALFLIAIIFILSFQSELSDIYTATLDRQGAITYRFLALDVAIDRFWLHPIFGNGPLDFGISASWVQFAINSHNSREVWIWQMLVAIAHDSGLVGFGLYMTFIAMLLLNAFRLATTKHSKQHAAYFAGFLVLFISSQSTTVHLTALFGIAMGLLGSDAPASKNRSSIPKRGYSSTPWNRFGGGTQGFRPRMGRTASASRQD